MHYLVTSYDLLLCNLLKCFHGGFKAETSVMASVEVFARNDGRNDGRTVQKKQICYLTHETEENLPY